MPIAITVGPDLAMISSPLRRVTGAQTFISSSAVLIILLCPLILLQLTLVLLLLLLILGLICCSLGVGCSSLGIYCSTLRCRLSINSLIIALHLIVESSRLRLLGEA